MNTNPGTWTRYGSSLARRVTLVVTALLLVLAFSVGARAQSCGDVDGNDAVTVSDGVNVLRAAAGLSGDCPPSVCDVDASGTITVSDGVNVLRAAAGLGATLSCAADPFISAVMGDTGVFGRLTKIRGGLTEPPGAAQTVMNVTVGDGFVSDRVNTVTVEYDAGGAQAQAAQAQAAQAQVAASTLLIASAPETSGPSSNVFELPLDAERGTVTLALDLKPGIDMQRIRLSIANGVGTAVVGRIVTVMIGVVRETAPACGNRVLDSGESCDPPGVRCAVSAHTGLCASNCTCQASSTCGNGIREPGEACDGQDASLCGNQLCRSNCACEVATPTPIASTPTPTPTATEPALSCFAAGMTHGTGADACQQANPASQCVIGQRLSDASFLNCSAVGVGAMCCEGEVPSFCIAAGISIGQTGAARCVQANPGTTCLVTQRGSDKSLSNCNFPQPKTGATALCCADPVPGPCFAATFLPGQSGDARCPQANPGSACLIAVREPDKVLSDCEVVTRTGGEAMCCGGL